MSEYKKLPILIVDDDENIHRLYQHILKRHGFEHILTARSGAEALNLLGVPFPGEGAATAEVAAAAVDLVILDVVLPDINGFDVCRWIKNSLSPFLPVILVSGYDHVRGIEAGADYFITKPINFDEFTAKVEALLARREKFNSISVPQSAGGQQGFPVIGQELDGYTVVDSLGWGGTTVIYKVSHPEVAGPLALKMLARHSITEAEVMHRFEREIDLMRRLHHPNIIAIHDAGHYDGCPYFVMEFIEGVTLDKLVEQSGPLDMDTVCTIAIGLAEALHAMHSDGIIHRDVKLKNSFYCRETKQVKLADFGVAIDVSEVRLTQTGYTVGTPTYMAPEQFEGGFVSPSTDVYSYGATLYHVITGRPPFEAANAMELMRKHFTQSPLPMSSLRADVPEEWDILVVDSCLAKKSDDRPQGMETVINSLSMLRDLPL